MAGQSVYVAVSLDPVTSIDWFPLTNQVCPEVQVVHSMGNLKKTTSRLFPWVWTPNSGETQHKYSHHRPEVTSQAQCRGGGLYGETWTVWRWLSRCFRSRDMSEMDDGASVVMMMECSLHVPLWRWCCASHTWTDSAATIVKQRTRRNYIQSNPDEMRERERENGRRV